MDTNIVLKAFSKWMSENATTLSESSIYKYTRGFNTISREMLEDGIIEKSLFDMSFTELEIALIKIFNNEKFIAKNKKGNHMYSNALKQFRCYSLSNRQTTTDNQEAQIINAIENDKSLSETERLSIVKSRIGQGTFRNDLFSKYDGRCIVTGIDISQLLIASHIKPWAVSDNNERISSDNGLLLSATFDKLFDCGLISFKENGDMIVSSFINTYNRKLIGINQSVNVNLKSTPSKLLNLEYHRDVLFVK